jgi:choline/ethanolamine kinase
MAVEQMTARSAKLIIVTFFKEWLSFPEQEIEVKPMTNGFSNIVTLVRRLDAAGKQLRQPTEVIIRMYGGNVFWKSKPKDPQEEVSPFTNFFNHKNDQTEETVIVYQLSKRGYGPKVYGIFRGGRVDEYIPSHTLKHEELEQNCIIQDLAVIYARPISLFYQKMPLQNKIHIVDQRIRDKLLSSKQNYADIVKQILSPDMVTLLQSLNVDTDKLRSFDYKKEWEWIFSMRKRIRSRKVMSSYDCNFLNVLVRDSVQEGESAIVLIDHEATLVGYRSQCIGCHFMNWMLKWKGTSDKRSGLPYPSEQKRRDFIIAYLTEQKRLAYIPDFDEDGFDSVDKVMMEADFGVLNAIMYSTFGLIAEIPGHGFVIDDPSFLRATIFLQEFYQQFKELSIQKHGW